MPSLTAFTGSEAVKTGIWSSRPSCCSWSTAAGRARSAATRAGEWPSLRRRRASFAEAVVFPEPWSPASRITVGGLLANASFESPLPMSAVSSSWTMRTTSCPGVRLFVTSAPSARSRTRATKSFTTLKLTSASSSARRTSRMAREIDSSSSLPRPRTSCSAACRRSESASNTAGQCTRRPLLSILGKDMATCLTCGEANPDHARFCLACGAPLEEPVAPREMRKTVTVVFSDLIDSTPLGESLDVESYRRMLSRYFIEVSRVLEHHGGTVEKFIGDAVMAVFGIPVVHEDDALRAVRAVTELREALHALNEELREEFGAELRFRTGINTGEVVAGDPSEGQAFATGDAVAVAQRLEAAASAGEILIGDPTYRLVREAVLVEPLEPLELKGKAEPVRAWRLLGVLSGAPAYARRTDAPMVGRDEELGRLRTAFEEAAATRECRVISVIGTAGIG